MTVHEGCPHEGIQPSKVLVQNLSLLEAGLSFMHQGKGGESPGPVPCGPSEFSVCWAVIPLHIHSQCEHLARSLEAGVPPDPATDGTSSRMSALTLIKCLPKTSSCSSAQTLSKAQPVIHSSPTPLRIIPISRVLLNY